MLRNTWGWSWTVFQFQCLLSHPEEAKAILWCSLALVTKAFQLFRLCLERKIVLTNLPLLSFTFLIISDSQTASAECLFLRFVPQILPLKGEYVRKLTWKNCNLSCSCLSFTICICRSLKLPITISFLKLLLGISGNLIPGKEKILHTERCKIKL